MYYSLLEEFFESFLKGVHMSVLSIMLLLRETFNFRGLLRKFYLNPCKAKAQMERYKAVLFEI